MFQFLANPHFNFMKRGPLLLALSGVLVLASVIVLLTSSLNLGIEFTGGTELQVKYATTPDIGGIRAALKSAGMTAQVTTIGEPDDHEVYIRLAEGGGPGEAAELTGLVTGTLRSGVGATDRSDLNIDDQATLERLLIKAPGLSPIQAAELAQAISDKRKEVAIFGSLEDLQGLAGYTSEVHEFLAQRAITGPLALRSQSYIGPAVGEELMGKARVAILLSLLMMLIYIWIRFQLQWGFAAVIALTHDTLITLALFSLMGKEMSLPVVAAFLTLVGYSVNDTVVVFDRIRENVRNRSAATFEETINLSINQTLGRTIITSGLTWIVVFGLYVYGGPALNPFAFVLTVGIVVGTFSSIYIASPLLLLWSRFADKKSGTAQAPAVRRTKKVRAS